MEPIPLLSGYPIEPYRGGVDKLRQIAVAFTGAPRNSDGPDRIRLLNDPGSQHSFLYEFRISDIVYAEEAYNLGLPNGSTISIKVSPSSLSVAAMASMPTGPPS